MGSVTEMINVECGMWNCRWPSIIVAAILVIISSSTGFTQETQLKVRKPVFAGQFYPGDKSGLETMVDNFLKEAAVKADKPSSHTFGLIAPHAGYVYSGRVAASAYSQIIGKPYKTVIIIGSSHQVAFKGIAIDPSGAWETPLGTVQIDQDVAQLLMAKCTSIKTYPAAFEKEHSLEVQLPFLQRTLKGFRIVPIVTGFLEGNDYRLFTDALLSALNQNPKGLLIVASSDMSHYHSYNQAYEMDSLALKDIEKMTPDRLAENLQKGQCELCGAQGVLTLLLVAGRLNGVAKTLSYANSGDVTRDKSRVVGYGAVAFSYREESQMLGKKEQVQLLTIARKTLEEYVSNRTVPSFEVKERKLLEKQGAFVTLTKGGQLRGCIGYIIPVHPLNKAVSDMTINAATKDPRFPPVSRDELKDIHIEISVLTPLRSIGSIDEIEVGKHGLYITKGNSSGLLLPQVATDYKWNREEFLQQTCRKAGLPQNAWKEKGAQIYIFSAQIFSE
jgi:MEMO1 family protein